MPDVKTRFQNAWNAFLGRDPTKNNNPYFYGSGERPDRHKLSYVNERSIINNIYNRLSVDAAAVNIEHVKVDENGRYVEKMDSGLQNCLTV